jgi:hypothetical protein
MRQMRVFSVRTYYRSVASQAEDRDPPHQDDPAPHQRKARELAWRINPVTALRTVGHVLMSALVWLVAFVGTVHLVGGRPPRSKLRGAVLVTEGIALWVIGIATVVFGLVIVVYPRAFPNHLPWWRWVVFPFAGGIVAGLGAGINWMGKYLVGLGRRHLARVVSSVSGLDGTPFILYLRTFADDQRLTGREKPSAASGIQSVDALMTSRLTEEEQLVRVLGRFARVIAVGKPGERLPKLGARRLYLADDAWQETVGHLIRQARLVFILAGRGSSLMWELTEAVSAIPWERVVLLIPMEAKDYQQFRDKAHEALAARAELYHQESNRTWLPPVLPDFPNQKLTFVNGQQHFTIKGAIYFKADVPRFVLFETRHVHGPNRKQGRAIARGLRPVLQPGRDGS